MKFSITAAVLAFAATVVALPPHHGDAVGNGVGNKGNNNVKFPVPENVTVKQASDKCGDNVQLSCCNSATYAGDSTEVNSSLLAGALSGLLGAGSGAQGLGLFEECSSLDLGAAELQDLVNQKCKQNIACCQNSPSSTDGDLVGLSLPCIALGSVL